MQKDNLDAPLGLRDWSMSVLTNNMFVTALLTVRTIPMRMTKCVQVLHFCTMQFIRNLWEISYLFLWAIFWEMFTIIIFKKVICYFIIEKKIKNKKVHNAFIFWELVKFFLFCECTHSNEDAVKVTVNQVMIATVRHSQWWFQRNYNQTLVQQQLSC